MKKIITIIAVLASISSLNAQHNFAPDGAEWNYKGGRTPYPMSGGAAESLTNYKVIEDSANSTARYIQVKVIKQSQELAIDNSTNSYQYFSRTSDSSTLYFKVTEDTVFYLNPVFQKYTPLYIFNVAVGDTFSIPITDTSNYTEIGNFNTFKNPAGDSVVTFIVDSIVPHTYNGIPEKTYHLRTRIAVDLNNPFGGVFYPQFNWITSLDIPFLVDSNHVQVQGAYSSLFGGLGSGLLPVQFGKTLFVDATYFYNYICNYADTAVNVNFGLTGSCDSFQYNTPLAIKSINQLGTIKIYPNPVSENEIHIQTEKAFSNETKLHILDILGKEVLSPIDLSNQIQKTINVSSLHAGVYFLVFESEGQWYYQKFQKL